MTRDWKSHWSGSGSGSGLGLGLGLGLAAGRATGPVGESLDLVNAPSAACDTFSICLRTCVLLASNLLTHLGRREEHALKRHREVAQSGNNC